MATYKVSAEILNAAIEGFESQKRRIDGEIDAIRNMLGGGKTEPAPTTEPQRDRRRKMTSAGRKAIAEAQRKRWAASKSGGTQNDTTTAKPERRLSAAGRRAISEATKKRWAAKRTAAARSAPAIAKKAAGKKANAKKATKTAVVAATSAA